MKGMRLLALSLAGSVLLAGQALAEIKTVINNYSYQATEVDNKQTARWTALEHSRELILGELGNYLEGVADVKNLGLGKDEVIALTAGITEPEIVKETWDGRVYWIEARISVDVDGIVASLAKLKKNPDLRKELERRYRVVISYLKEKEALNKQLTEAYYDENKSNEDDEATVSRVTDAHKQGERFLAQAKDAAKMPGAEKQAREYRQKAIEHLGEAMVLTELPDFRVYIPGKKYSFSLKEGEQTDHWIMFPDDQTDFKFLQAKGSKFTRVYDSDPAGANKHKLKLRAVKNSYIVLEVGK